MRGVPCIIGMSFNRYLYLRRLSECLRNFRHYILSFSRKVRFIDIKVYVQYRFSFFSKVFNNIVSRNLNNSLCESFFLQNIQLATSIVRTKLYIDIPFTLTANNIELYLFILITDIPIAPFVRVLLVVAIILIFGNLAIKNLDSTHRG